MNSIFFGDSITEGCNSDCNFTQYLGIPTNNRNLAVSGTTIGEYSIYPVDGSSLSSIYPKVDDLYMYTRVFLEYGINDVSAIMCGFTDIEKVIISFVKAIDGIKQKTKADIKFLSLSTNDDIIYKYAELQCDYLSYDYFKGYDFTFPASVWADTYRKLIDAFSKRVDIIPMINDIKFFHENAECIGNDNLHPNEKGHYIIAETIDKYI